MNNAIDAGIQAGRDVSVTVRSIDLNLVLVGLNVVQFFIVVAVLLIVFKFDIKLTKHEENVDTINKTTEYIISKEISTQNNFLIDRIEKKCSK